MVQYRKRKEKKKIKTRINWEKSKRYKYTLNINTYNNPKATKIIIHRNTYVQIKKQKTKQTMTHT